MKIDNKLENRLEDAAKNLAEFFGYRIGLPWYFGIEIIKGEISFRDAIYQYRLKMEIYEMCKKSKMKHKV